MAYDTQLKKGVLEGCVLKLLETEFRFSGEIVTAMKASGFTDFSEGTLYPMLMRLEKAGYFEIAKVASPNGPPKKYYRLSDVGKAWLAQFERLWKETENSVNLILGGSNNAE